MTSQGYVAIHRKMLENPIVMKDTEHCTVWLYLLLNATYSEHKAIFAGKEITLKRGQLIISRNKISNDLKINESKIKRILENFRNYQQIEQQTTPNGSLITIVNWELYQKNEKQITAIQEEPLSIKEPKHIYGEYKKVKLKDSEQSKLLNELGTEKFQLCIKMLDEYKEQNGKKYASDYLAIRNWVIKAVNQELKKGVTKKGFNEFQQNQYDYDALEKQLLSN